MYIMIKWLNIIEKYYDFEKGTIIYFVMYIKNSHIINNINQKICIFLY